MRAAIELPSLDSLPREMCRVCHKSKIRGLFTPAELRSTYPRCMVCVGEVNEKQRAKKHATWREL